MEITAQAERFLKLTEHNKNVEYLQSVLESYYELPPIYNYCDDFYKEVTKGRSCLKKEEMERFWYDDLKSKSSYIGIDFISYFPPYVKLNMKTIRYRREDLDQWMKERIVTTG